MHQPKTSQLNGYIVGKTIGRGTFGKVKRGIHKLTNQPVAIKFLQKQKIKDITDIERVSRELHILKLVRHPNIAQLYQIIQTPLLIYIIMQYAIDGQYFDYVMDGKVKNQQQACLYFQQIVSALIYLHKLKISHRDVKPQNMLLDTNRKIKLVDFGLSNMYKQGEMLSTACGSPCYASPQMIRGQDYYDPQLTDVWSLGIVLYTSVMGQLPFEDEDTNSLYTKIKSGIYILNKSISPQLKDLLSRMINIKLTKRITLNQILCHPWYKLYSSNKQTSGIQIGFQKIPIDRNVVDQMQSLGYQSKKTIKYLDNNIKNQCTTTYYLFLKRNFKLGTPSKMDICSDTFQKKFIMPIFSIKQKRHKSFDLGRMLEKQQKQPSFRKNNRNCVSQFKYRYSQPNNIEQKRNSLTKSSKRHSKQQKNIQSLHSFIKLQAQSQLKKRLIKIPQIRNKSLSVSYSSCNNKTHERFTTQIRSTQKSYQKKLSIKIIAQQQRLKQKKTNFIQNIYGKNKNKTDTKQKKRQFKKEQIYNDIQNYNQIKDLHKRSIKHIHKQQMMQPNQDTHQKSIKSIHNNINVDDIFWRKKSTNPKPNTMGRSVQYTQAVRKNTYM